MGLPPEMFDGKMSPGEVIRAMLAANAWAQEDLAAIVGRSRQALSAVIADRAAITPELAIALGAASGNPPADWLRLDAGYRLSLLADAGDDAERRAKVYSAAPVREMQRRGWIKDTIDLDELESEIKSFYEIESLDEAPTLSVATRRPQAATPLTAAERAWCVRARRLARLLQANRFDAGKLVAAEEKLRELAAYPKEARHLTRALGNFGIRFVVIEPLAGAKIDGAAFWLKEDQPVIAVSLRMDRVDSCWFTIMHEFEHIKHGDALSVDTELVTDGGIKVATDDAEDRANRAAASALVPADELSSFIRRFAPLYSTQRIIQFAHRIRIHPGIIVGQLHHRGEVHYRTHRDLLVKIREVITETSLTDGWGQSIAPGTV